MGMEIIDSKTTKYKHCYKCVRYYGVRTIQVKDKRAVTMPDEYILCSYCLKICPQSARILKSDLDVVRGLLRGGMRVVVSIIPPCMGLLKYKTIGQVRRVLLCLRFKDVREIFEGTTFVTAEYAELLVEHKMENVITTCCPSANDLVEIYYPQLIPYLTPVVPPMITHGGLPKEEPERDVKVVFPGSHITKEKEALDLRHEGYIDIVLNFNDTSKWLEEEGIAIEDCEDRLPTVFDPKMNRLHPVTSNVVNSVLATEERGGGHRKFYVHGEDNCIDLCKSMSRDEIKDCFIEMNMCSGGCIKGPTVDEEFIPRFRVKPDMKESICREPAEEKQMEPAWENINLRKRFEDHSPRGPQPTEEQIREVPCMTSKLKPKDRLNRGACGYPACWEKAIVIFQHKAEVSMCTPFMHKRTESMANLVMETSPNIVPVVGDDMRVMEYSDVGKKYFGRTRSQALQMHLYELIDPVNSQWVFDTYQDIHGRRVNYSEYNFSTLQNIVYIERENAVPATLMDITREGELAKEEHKKRLETIDLTQKVVHEQMMVTREIVGLLGETIAETKTTLTKLCHSLLEDGSDIGYAEGELERGVPNVQLGSGATPLKGVMTAGTSGQTPGAEQILGVGHTLGAGEQRKPTGYVHIDSASPRGGKSGYVHLSNTDLKGPGNDGGK